MLVRFTLSYGRDTGYPTPPCPKAFVLKTPPAVGPFMRLDTSVHLLHRYYASVRLPRRVHVVLAEIPSPTGPSVDCRCPRMGSSSFRAVGLQACPGSLTPQVPNADRANATPCAAFLIGFQGRQPGRGVFVAQ